MPDTVWGLADTKTFVDPLYDFDYATRLFDGEAYDEGRPRPFFFIGCTPGGLELLVSLRRGDEGAIFSWFGSSVPWGTEDNGEAALYLQAKSFPEFVASLYDTDDRIGYDYWKSPRHTQLAKPFDLKQ